MEILKRFRGSDHDPCIDTAYEFQRISSVEKKKMNTKRSMDMDGWNKHGLFNAQAALRTLAF